MAKMEKEDIKQDKAIIKKAFKMHDKQEHKGGKGTNLTKLSKGGKTNDNMKSMGSNMAKLKANGK
jgi:hypothetical protein